MLMLYSGLTFALRGWDAGDTNGRRTADRQVATNFLRRELAELFPMRFKDPMTLKFAFEGKAEHAALRLVARRRAFRPWALSLVGIAVEDSPDGSRRRDLVMRRAMPDDDAKDFGPLDRAERTVLFEDVERVSFAATSAPRTTSPIRPGSMRGSSPGACRRTSACACARPTARSCRRWWCASMLGEEAGCLENSFQRVCRPRRET